jgi:FKBP-type peptidyl-prolyl cis-trans isomerase (trigger factor)
MKRIIFKDLAVTTTAKEHSQIEIDITCPNSAFAEYRPAALKQLGQEITLPGFRKGHVPEKILLQKVGVDRLLSEMADLAIQDAYIAVLLEKKLDPLGQPRVTVMKIAEGNDLVFKIVISVLPEINLPDYKSIAKKVFAETKPVEEIPDSEIDDTLTNIRKHRAQAIHKRADIKNEDLPPLDDAFAKSLGEFENVDALKAHLKKEIIADKNARGRDKARMQTLEAIVKEASIDVPLVLIEGELDRMTGEFEHTLSRTGAKLDDYLTQSKMTRETLRASWKSDAEKRVKGQLVLGEIARTEKITPPEEAIEHEMELLARHYHGADPVRLRGYVEMMLGNDAVFSFLEGQAEKK